MKSRLSGAGLVLAVALMVGMFVGAARAAAPVRVGLFGCVLGNGTATVPSGVPLLGQGRAFWTLHGTAIAYEKKQTTMLTITKGGTTTVADATNEYLAPDPTINPPFWTDVFLHDLGTLAPGEQMLVHVRLSFDTPLTAPSPLVFFDAGPGVGFDYIPVGVFVEGDCLITAT